MTNWLYRFSLISLALLGAIGCREELDIDSLTNFAPSILPGNINEGGSVVAGDFGITVYFADGTTSPLTSGTVALRDSAGLELFTTTKALSGVRDSIVVAGSEFNSQDLPVGNYSLYVSATDNAGQTTEETYNFTISALPFPANIGQLFIAGGFNGWAATEEALEGFEFELVAANTWEISGIDLEGGPWKLKNTVDWTDTDWGDGDCDGFMTSNADGNADTDCGASGLSTIRFNDQTLAYEVIPEVTIATNLDGLFLLGTFDGVTNTLGGGDTYEFELVGDNQYDLAEITLRPGDQFKFAEMVNFQGQQFGDSDFMVGVINVAEAGGPAITLPADFEAGVYAIAFNDETLEYSIDFLRDAGFRSIGILGVGLPGGFGGPDLDLQDDDGDGIWEYEGLVIDSTGFTSDDGNLRVKFRADDAWDVNWGGDDFPMGVATMGGPDIPVREGTYDVTFAPETGEYNFTEVTEGFGSIGIIGSALPNGWDSDYDLRDEDNDGNTDGVYELFVGLKDGEVKFRADDDWATSWGGAFPSDTDSDATGGNIPVTAGLYKVTFTPATGEYTFTETTIGIIGDATPGGWDADTDLTFDASRDDANVLTLDITLGEGAVKFRANDEWVDDWGGSDFPSGTAVYKGDNIPSTPGDYTVSFNILTLEYSFD